MRRISICASTTNSTTNCNTMANVYPPANSNACNLSQ